MAEAASDAFLSGQGIPVDLSKIEGALADLWGPAAEREGGPDLESPAVTRVTLANLVVIDVGTKSACAEEVLDTVVARYPCRAIVVRRDESAGRSLRAEISAVCHLPAPGMPQVCSERILLRTGSDGFDLVPGAVRPLLESDLPLVLWWVGDPLDAPSLYQELAPEASRVVMDLADPSADPETVAHALDLASSPFGRDLSWFGITRWRELTAQFFDPIGREETLKHLTTVTIVAESTSSDLTPRVAAWLAAWLAGQLGWTRKSRSVPAPGKLEATFQGPNGEVTVNLWSEMHDHADPAAVSSVSLTADEGSDQLKFRLTRINDSVAVESETQNECRLPRMVHAEEFTMADRVSAALESARDDPPYRSALPHMIWLVGGNS